MSPSRLLALPLAAAALLAGSTTAAACGGLVAPNGAVRLAHVSTLAAWSDGIEHYETSFAYAGSVPSLGWLVPLPAVPDRVEAGGRWTLQRLERETFPVRFDAAGAAAPAAAADVQVLQQTTVDALDLTVLRGTGGGVLDWAAQNGFTVNPETRAHILGYAAESPIFLAARYDLAAAQERGFLAGDGTPVLITMHTPRPWVPLEVLANGSDPIAADVWLLTDTRPRAGDALPAAGVQLAPGLTVVRQQPASDRLLSDLRSDRNMGWIPASAWLTALRVSGPGTAVTYDLTVADGVLATPDAAHASPASVPPVAHGTTSARMALILGLALPALAVAGALLLVVAARSRGRREYR